MWSTTAEPWRGLVVGQKLEKIDLASPFLLRTVEPALCVFHGKRLVRVWREAKQIVLDFDSGEKLLIHLMIAGRLRWRPEGKKVPKTNPQATFCFEAGNLIFTEAGKKKRARLYALPVGAEALEPFQKGGMEVLECSLQLFQERLQSEVGEGFPEKVTAFHPEMSVHGRYGEPCSKCGQTVQRIRYADNETNYCPQGQNEGRLLADRSLSRLLKSDLPKTAEELEYHLESRKR